MLTAIDNPLVQELEPMVEGSYQFTRSFAERHPQVVAEEVAITAVGGAVFRVRARIANRGRLPTNITNVGAELPRLQPVRVSLILAEGVELLSERGHQDLGHLRPLTGSHIVEWFVQAPTVAVGAKIGILRVLGGTGGDSLKTLTRP